MANYPTKVIELIKAVRMCSPPQKPQDPVQKYDYSNMPSFLCCTVFDFDV